MKLARLLEMPEKEFEERVRELEGRELFGRLVGLGVVSVQPYSQARLSARRFGGWGLRTSSEGVPELLDGRGELVELIQGVGQERFEECFLRGEKLSDEARAGACGISLADARRLREFVDRLYVQEEFEAGSSSTVPAAVFSSVAGVDLEGGKVVLGFFNRDIWKGRYRIDDGKRAQLFSALSPAQRKRAEKLLSDLEFLERRKSTLFRVLERLVEAQKDYFVSRDPARRRPLTQRALASELDVAPSVLNRLISNKAVQMPWGLEVPIKTLVPSAKAVLRDHLHDLARERPELSDEGLRLELQSQHGARLSRRSIAQYRKELGLGGRRQRSAVEAQDR